MRELKVKANVLESCASLNKYLVDYYDKSCVYIDWLTENYSELIDTYEALGGDENKKIADEWREEYIAIIEKDIEYKKANLEEYETYETPKNLFYMYVEMGNSYSSIIAAIAQMDGEVNVKKQIACSEIGCEYLKKAEKIDATADVKHGIFNLIWAAAFFYTIDGECKNFDKSLELYDECEEYLPCSAHFISRAAFVYLESQITAERAFVHRHMKNIEKALELYEESIELAEYGLSILEDDQDGEAAENLNERLERSKKFIKEIKDEQT